MKNLEQAAEKIESAENIVIYTDSDLDGVTSGLIAKKTFEEIGKKPSIFFTNKEDRGYGLNVESVEMLADKAPGLLVTMDCGISDFEGVKKAKELGFEVIILDHHKPHERVPEADLIVCPKLHGDYFKERPNAGIILELSELLLNKKRDDFIELTALAIFGDMMPHEGPNAEVLFEARNNFPATTGMKIFKDIFKIDQPMQLFQKVSPILNVTKMVSNAPEAFLFFLTIEEEYGKGLAQSMIDSYKARKEKVEEIKKSLLEEAEEKEIIFAGSEDWPSFLLGKIASQVLNEVDKPVFIYRKKGAIAQGSVRVPKKYDAVEAMKSTEDLLENYGGHPPAAGFTIKIEKLEEFEDNLIKYFKKIQ
ncbi:MAG: DHHA1 domain-containing protein [Patescibacteria group bacterium]